jgi:dTDP-4-dehydrorhamnose 3,5-epimerase
VGTVSVDQIQVTPLKRIPVDGGDVLHAIKNGDLGYAGFGEAYFSIVELGTIKAWKRHLRMTLNLVVPVGQVIFVFVDEIGDYRLENVGPSRYVRLTVPPGIWFGFKGLSHPISMLMNIANIAHDPSEVERKGLSEIAYKWH